MQTVNQFENVEKDALICDDYSKQFENVDMTERWTKRDYQRNDYTKIVEKEERLERFRLVNFADF